MTGVLLAGKPKGGTSSPFVWGTVQSVTSDLTACQVLVDGSSTTLTAYLPARLYPAAGDRVQCFHQGQKFYVWDDFTTQTTFTSGVVSSYGSFPVTTNVTSTSGPAFTIKKTGVYRIDATCTAWCPNANIAAARGIYWYLDGVLRSAANFYWNQGSVHTTMPTQRWLQTLTAGTHHVVCANGGDLNMDVNDALYVGWALSL